MSAKGNKTTIGEAIKTARVKLNLSADQVGQLCNVSRSRVYQWEAQEYVFPKNLAALAAALHVSLRRLKAMNGRPDD